MRKVFILLIAVLALFSLGFARKLPSPSMGVYDAKLRTLTFFDIVSKDFNLSSGGAEVLETKPESLQVKIDYDKLEDVKFGYFKLGNNEQKVWFLLGKNSTTNRLDFYIDQDANNELAEKERVESFQAFDRKASGYNITEYFTMIPVSLRVTYKGEKSLFQKKLYFFLSVDLISKKNSTDTIVYAYTASFLEGEMKVQTAKGEKLVKIRIMDNNGNACFNDYGKDLIYMDVNADEFFRKNEFQPLTEFYDYPTSKKEKVQLRLVVLPLPAKLAVVEAAAEIDRSLFEPVSDPEEQEKEPVKTEGVPDDKTKPTTVPDAKPASVPEKPAAKSEQK